MAQQVETKLIDDLDGSVAAETVRFAFEGRDYEIDLSEANASRLRDAMAEFLAGARKAGAANYRRPSYLRPGPPPVRRPAPRVAALTVAATTAPPPPAVPPVMGGGLSVVEETPAPAAPGPGTGAWPPKRTDAAEIRAWAKEQGFDLSDRGRIPADISALYDARPVTPVKVSNAEVLVWLKAKGIKVPFNRVTEVLQSRYRAAMAPTVLEMDAPGVVAKPKDATSE